MSELCHLPLSVHAAAVAQAYHADALNHAALPGLAPKIRACLSAIVAQIILILAGMIELWEQGRLPRHAPRQNTRRPAAAAPDSEKTMAAARPRRPAPRRTPIPMPPPDRAPRDPAAAAPRAQIPARPAGGPCLALIPCPVRPARPHPVARAAQAWQKRPPAFFCAFPARRPITPLLFH